MNFLRKALFIALAVSGLVFAWTGLKFSEPDISEPDIIVKKEILTGSTFSVLASQAGLATTTANEILASAKSVYDLSQIKAGKELAFVFNKTSGELKELIYEIDHDELLSVKNVSTSTTVSVWQATKAPIEYKIEIASAKGVIESSLYETIVEQGLDERLALMLAETFAWQIDFAGEIQKGDSFKVIYEKKFRNGNYSHPGKILAAEFINAGRLVRGFYWEGGESPAGYYDENGESLQKIFLKSPLQYKYISSGFSYARLNPITKKVSPHRGIDYAANYGTPAVAVGDGTVIQAGWNGYYGISVTIRHNDTYRTVYGHFQSLARGIKVGAKVKQGQVVGYVGSTGLATGPHLHYEMHKFNSYVNPFTVEIPAGEPLKEADRSKFAELVKEYNGKLARI
jgi:murein DD-endopeptidase MepM/ murein hydrolase activator NlpD